MTLTTYSLFLPPVRHWLLSELARAVLEDYRMEFVANANVATGCFV